MQSTQQTGSATATGAAAGSAPSSGPHRSLVSLARAARPSLGSTAVTPRSFTIRWDRTAIALLVVLGLLTAVITGLAALFGAPTGAVAGISLLVAALGVAGLRLLALRDRKRRTDRQIEAAFEEAAAPASVGTVFDAAASAPWAVRTAAAAAFRLVGFRLLLRPGGGGGRLRRRRLGVLRERGRRRRAGQKQQTQRAHIVILPVEARR